MANPVINTHPISTAYIIGNTVTLSVVAVSDPIGTPLTYQWKLNGSNITGKTSSSLVLTNLQLIDAGSYTVVVSCSGNDLESNAAILTCDSIMAAIIRNRKNVLKTISTTAGYTFTPLAVEEERLFFNINGRFPYILLLRSPADVQQEDNYRDFTNTTFIVCYFDNYNDEDQTKDEITYKYRNVVADIVRAWMTDRTCGELMEGTKLIGYDEGIVEDGKGNMMFRVTAVFDVFGFIDSNNPYLKG